MFGWLKNLFVKPFVPVTRRPSEFDNIIITTTIVDDVQRAKRKVDECASMYPPLIMTSYDFGGGSDTGNSFDCGGGCDCGGGGCD